MSHISLGRVISCQHGAFSGVGAAVASFVPAECPKCAFAPCWQELNVPERYGELPMRVAKTPNPKELETMASGL